MAAKTPSARSAKELPMVEPEPVAGEIGEVVALEDVAVPEADAAPWVEVMVVATPLMVVGTMRTVAPVLVAAGVDMLTVVMVLATPLMVVVKVTETAVGVGSAGARMVAVLVVATPLIVVVSTETICLDMVAPGYETWVDDWVHSTPSMIVVQTTTTSPVTSACGESRVTVKVGLMNDIVAVTLG